MVCHRFSCAFTTCLLWPQGWARRQPVRLTANGTLDVGPVTGTVRMHTVWNSVATGVAWWQHDGVHMPRRIMQPPAKVLAAVTPAVLPHDSARPSSAGGPVPEGEQPPGTPLIQGRFGMLRRGSLRSGSWTGSLAADGLAAPGAPPPSLQLHFETNVLASSRLQLLDEQDEAVVVVCGSGVSVSLTSQVADSPGSISENSPVLARSNVFATPVKGQRRASGVASAAATPQAMRQVSSCLPLGLQPAMHAREPSTKSCNGVFQTVGNFCEQQMCVLPQSVHRVSCLIQCIESVLRIYRPRRCQQRRCPRQAAGCAAAAASCAAAAAVGSTWAPRRSMPRGCSSRSAPPSWPLSPCERTSAACRSM